MKTGILLQVIIMSLILFDIDRAIVNRLSSNMKVLIHPHLIIISLILVCIRMLSFPNSKSYLYNFSLTSLYFIKLQPYQSVKGDNARIFLNFYKHLCCINMKIIWHNYGNSKISSYIRLRN